MVAAIVFLAIAVTTIVNSWNISQSNQRNNLEQVLMYDETNNTLCSGDVNTTFTYKGQYHLFQAPILFDIGNCLQMRSMGGDSDMVCLSMDGMTSNYGTTNIVDLGTVGTTLQVGLNADRMSMQFGTDPLNRKNAIQLFAADTINFGPEYNVIEAGVLGTAGTFRISAPFVQINAAGAFRTLFDTFAATSINIAREFAVIELGQLATATTLGVSAPLVTINGGGAARNVLQTTSGTMITMAGDFDDVAIGASTSTLLKSNAPRFQMAASGSLHTVLTHLSNNVVEYCETCPAAGTNMLHQFGGILSGGASTVMQMKSRTDGVYVNLARLGVASGLQFGVAGGVFSRDDDLIIGDSSTNGPRMMALQAQQNIYVASDLVLDNGKKLQMVAQGGFTVTPYTIFEKAGAQNYNFMTGERDSLSTIFNLNIGPPQSQDFNGRFHMNLPVADAAATLSTGNKGLAISTGYEGGGVAYSTGPTLEFGSNSYNLAFLVSNDANVYRSPRHMFGLPFDGGVTTFFVIDPSDQFSEKEMMNVNTDGGIDTLAIGANVGGGGGSPFQNTWIYGTNTASLISGGQFLEVNPGGVFITGPVAVTSDERTKENIKDPVEVDEINKFMQTRFRRFDYKDGYCASEYCHNEFGVIAQEQQLIDPDFVHMGRALNVGNTTLNNTLSVESDPIHFRTGYVLQRTRIQLANVTTQLTATQTSNTQLQQKNDQLSAALTAVCTHLNGLDANFVCPSFGD